MKDIVASMAVLTSFSQFLCIFCCVVPAATGILALLSVFGFTGANGMILGDLSMALHPYRGLIMTVSVCLISLSWTLHFYGKIQEKLLAAALQSTRKNRFF